MTNEKWKMANGKSFGSLLVKFTFDELDNGAPSINDNGLARNVI